MINDDTVQYRTAAVSRLSVAVCSVRVSDLLKTDFAKLTLLAVEGRFWGLGLCDDDDGGGGCGGFWYIRKIHK